MKSIVFIVPYYGTFPTWFQLWLDSCGQNPTIDWLVFTDIPTDCYSIPSNVKFKHVTFPELRQKIQHKYDFPIRLEFPYKLCDFRPAYGEIFSEYISSYTYWGYCDLDVVWGNIRHFLTDDLLEVGFDKIFNLGHCTLYRNTAENNRVYRRTIDGLNNYKQVFSSPQSFYFDEQRGIVAIFDHSQRKVHDNVCCFDVEFRRYKFQPSRSMLRFHPDFKKKTGVFQWSDGTLEYAYLDKDGIQKKEFMYVHFQKRIMHIHLQLGKVKQYCIIPNRFIPNLELSNKEIKKAQPSGLIYWALLKTELKQKIAILLHKQKVTPFYKGKIDRILYFISMQK